MKGDFAGDWHPSGYSVVDGAWWHIMILALNLNSAMKRLVLGETWVEEAPGVRENRENRENSACESDRRAMKRRLLLWGTSPKEHSGSDDPINACGKMG
jgi:hypothetical protein